MSVTRSLTPLTVRMVSSGMIVMYQGMVEITGTHWKPQPAQMHKKQGKKINLKHIQNLKSSVKSVENDLNQVFV